MKSYKLIIKPIEEQSFDKWYIIHKMGKEGYFENPNNPTTLEKCQLVSDWTGKEVVELMKSKRVEIDAAYSAVLRIVSEFHKERHETKRMPRQEINGCTFRMDYEKMSAGWWHHKDNVDSSTDPYSIMALVYIEEGMDYAEEDKNGNILNLVSARVEKLKPHLTLADYIEVWGFFLHKYDISKLRF